MTTKATDKNSENRFYGTGRRKTSVARIWLSPGTGAIIINEKPLQTYFGREALVLSVRQPFEVTGLADKWNVRALVHGGGVSSQSEAIRHGIARALLVVDTNTRKSLKTNGLLTRDPREKERRKVGRRKARRRPQYSKR